MILSPTQIESYDPTTPFGCKRKWWFERIDLRPKGIIGGGELGTAVHTTLEDFLRGGPQGGLHDLVIGAPGALEWLIKLRPRVVVIEKKFDDLLLAGVPVQGRIDWIANIGDDGALELGDHKTTSVIAKYAKTAGEIKKSIQMNVYAKHLVSGGALEGDDTLRMTQDYYQTKGAKKFEAVSCETTKREINSRILEVEATIEEMVKASKVTRPEEIEPNLKACNIGFGCPHRAYCPRAGEFNMASLFDAFAAPATKYPEPVVSALPPDAPASNPALAADEPKVALPKLVIDDSKNPTGDAVAPATPLPTPEPATVVPPEGTPKKGRKPGSKNKPHATDEEIAQMKSVAVVPSVPSLGPVTVNRIMIRHGVKIGKPNYSSATIEVEMEGTVNGSLEAAKEALSLQVRGAMRKELEVYDTPATPVKP